MADGFREKNIKSWIEDDFTLQLLDILLPQEELLRLKAIERQDAGFAQMLIDLQIMKQASMLINGQMAAQETLSQAVDMLKKVRGIEIDMKRQSI